MKDINYWIDYAKKNKDVLKIAGFVILIIIIAVPVYFYYRTAREKESVNILTGAVNTYNAVEVTERERTDLELREEIIDNLPADKAEEFEKMGLEEQAFFIISKIKERKLNAVKNQFENVISNYAGTSSYEQAIVYLGKIYYELRDYEKAIDYYNMYLSRYSNTTASGAVLLAKANALEETGMYDEALETYGEIINNERYAFLSSNALFNAALINEARGDKEDALAKFKEIAESEDETSFLKQQAKEKVVFLSAG